MKMEERELKSEACEKLAMAYVIQEKPPEKLLNLFENACKFGVSLPLCFVVHQLSNDKKYETMFQEKLKHFTAECEKSNGQACAQMALQSNDPMKYLKKACLNGHVESCNDVGEAYLSEEKYEQASPFFKKACDLQNGRGCSILFAIQLSLNNEKEITNAGNKAVKTKYCQYGYPNPHYILAGTTENPAHAEELVREGCDTCDDVPSCFIYAFNQYEKSPQIAKTYFKKACGSVDFRLYPDIYAACLQLYPNFELPKE